MITDVLRGTALPPEREQHNPWPVLGRWHTSGVQVVGPRLPVVSLVPRSTTGYRL